MSSSSKRRVAAIASTFILFVATLGLVKYIEVEDLHLSSYLQSEENDNHPSQYQINATMFEQSLRLVDDEREETEKQLVLVKSAHLSSLDSNISTPPRKNRSPACHPHFHHFTSNTTWNTAKFKRIYFYHTRKAGGTSLGNYFSRVADQYGLEFDQGEWIEAEEPGTHELPTFYVTHLREPVSQSVESRHKISCRIYTLLLILRVVFFCKVARSISHFKCENLIVYFTVSI